jgi:tetratricopeptide (TPR) repeat protein
MAHRFIKPKSGRIRAVLGKSLKWAGLLLCFVFLRAQSGSPSLDAMKAGLPALNGKARLAALLDLANSLEAKLPQEGLAYAVEGIALAVREGDREKEAACLTTAAYCCSQTGDFVKAIEYGKKALSVGTEIGNRERVARAHNTLGITYTFTGNYSQALEESFEALRIREALGDERLITQSLNLVGVVYHNSGQYEKAIDYFNQILKRVENKPEPRRLILAKLNIGFAQYKLGRFAEALGNHQEALALALKFDETAHVPYAYLNLGLTYTDLRQFDKAMDYLRQAQSGYRTGDQKHGLVQVLNAMARLHLLSGDTAKGIPLAKEGAELAQKINARDYLNQSYQLISDLYEKQGNVVESYRYYKLAEAVKDSIYSVQESIKIAETSMKIVSIRKDHEIDTLKKEQLISSLKIEKQRYFSTIFISSIGFLVAIIFILMNYNRKTQQTKQSLEKTNAELAVVNGELRDKVDEIKTLSGLLPICSHCKKIRDDAGYWTQLEGYISEHTSATFTHGICPHCADDMFPEAMKGIRAKGGIPPLDT